MTYEEINILADAWKEENYPNGTEVYLDDNICECEHYTMGEKRCSCGNRRISTYVEGTPGDFYLIAEPY